jgi:hypothetical protein
MSKAQTETPSTAEKDLIYEEYVQELPCSLSGDISKWRCFLDHGWACCGCGYVGHGPLTNNLRSICSILQGECFTIRYLLARSPAT